MKICVLTHTFPRFSGDTISSIFMAELAQSLVDAGNKVWVLTPYTLGFRKQKKSYKTLTYKYIFPDSLHRLGYSETLSNDMGLPFMMWILSPFMYFFGFMALMKLVKKERIDIISAHWILPNGFIAVAASLLTEVPVVSTLPGSDVYMARKNLLFNLLARFAARRSKWITSNSGQLIIDLEKSTGVKSESKQSVIPYGIGSSNFRPDKIKGEQTRKSLGVSPKEIVVLGVGRLVAKKGFRYLIKAAEIVIGKQKNIKFVLIGDGEERLLLKNLVTKLKLSKYFLFLGNISYTKMNGYYNAADIFVLPSIRDEKGNLDDQSVAVVDAMACGKPVITTDFPGYRQVIDDGKSGFLVRERDYQDIAKKIVGLINSNKLRQDFGAKSLHIVATKLSWKTIGEQYSEVFSNLRKGPFYSQALPSILDRKGRNKKARQIYNVLSSHLGETRGLRCLDVGCSDGTITYFLAKHFEEVIGVDVDREALKRASADYKRKNLKFELSPGEKLNYPSGYFDVAIANQIYEFVDDAEKTISEIYRVLKKGGVCFLGARNKYALIEAQYKLPFLSLLPRSIADWVVKLTGRGDYFIGRYRSYQSLRKLVSKFQIHDYTLEILRNPDKYGFKEIAKYKFLIKILPLEILHPLIPNYIWILEKR